ncbi:MAG: hypothetical protein ACHQHN_12590 [Sphingobacteriales bacterium]
MEEKSSQIKDKKSMFNRPDYALLLYLEEHGVTEETDVSPFIVKHYKNKSSKEKKIKISEDLAVQLLAGLAKKGYISIDKEELAHIQTWYKSAEPIPEDELPFWFDTLQINASLTFEGMEHLNQIKINQTVAEANKTLALNSGKQTSIFNWQKWFLGITMIASLITTAIALKSCSENDSNHRQEKEIDSLRLKLKQSESTKMNEPLRQNDASHNGHKDSNKVIK